MIHCKANRITRHGMHNIDSRKRPYMKPFNFALSCAKSQSQSKKNKETTTQSII